MPSLTLQINGKKHTCEVEGRTLLVELLREDLKLTGTHVGCDTSQCGACVVHLGGRAVKACSILALACEGAEITTIEGIARDQDLHPMQAAFNEHHGLQCGFCTPGMIMAGIDIANRLGRKLSPAQVRAELDGNLCRCTGYDNIVKAICAGAANMPAASGAGDV